MIRKIDFELHTPIKYAGGANGTEVETQLIELHEPTGKVAHLCGGVEAMIQRALLATADMLDEDAKQEAIEQAHVAQQKKGPLDEDDEGTDDVIDAETMVSILMSSGVDMEKLVVTYKELFKSVAFMDGQKRMTASRLDDMSYSDLRRMIGVYTANFIRR